VPLIHPTSKHDPLEIVVDPSQIIWTTLIRDLIKPIPIINPLIIITSEMHTKANMN
jgi:hypothetical protein